MKFSKVLSVALIFIFSVTIFSGCKRDEMVYNLVIASSVAGIIGATSETLNFLFPGGLFRHNVKYTNFVDKTYGFSFDYPTEIDGETFNDKSPVLISFNENLAPSSIGSAILTASSVTKNNSVIIIDGQGNTYNIDQNNQNVISNGARVYSNNSVHINTNNNSVSISSGNDDNSSSSNHKISSNNGRHEITTSGETIRIKGDDNEIFIKGTGNLVKISGNRNIIHSDNNEISFSGDDNTVQGSSNSIQKDSGNGNKILNDAQPQSPPPTKPVTPEIEKSAEKNPPAVVKPVQEKIAVYRVNLKNSTIDIGTKFCNGYENMKSELENQYSGLEDKNLGNRTFEFNYGNIQKRVFFVEETTTNHRQRFYYVEWNRTGASEFDEQIAQHVLSSFKILN